MKLLILGCKTLREGVVVSTIFFVAGLVLVLASQHVLPAYLYMDLIVLLAGFVMLLLTPVILVSTFLLTVLPGVKRDLDRCDR